MGDVHDGAFTRPARALRGTNGPKPGTLPLVGNARRQPNPAPKNASGEPEHRNTAESHRAAEPKRQLALRRRGGRPRRKGRRPFRLGERPDRFLTGHGNGRDSLRDRPPTSTVSRAAHVARARTAFEHASRSRPSTAAPASGSPRCSSIIAPDQIWPIGLAMPLPGDVRRRAVHRLEHRRKVALRIEVGRGRDADRAGDGRARDRRGCRRRDSSPRPRRTSPGCCTKCAVRMSMWYWSVRTSG